MFPLVQPTYAFLGYEPQPHDSLSSSLEDVYSLAEEGALYGHLEKIVPKHMRYRTFYFTQTPEYHSLIVSDR